MPTYIFPWSGSSADEKISLEELKKALFKRINSEKGGDERGLSECNSCDAKKRCGLDCEFYF